MGHSEPLCQVICPLHLSWGLKPTGHCGPSPEKLEGLNAGAQNSTGAKEKQQSMRLCSHPSSVGQTCMEGDWSKLTQMLKIHGIL